MFSALVDADVVNSYWMCSMLVEEPEKRDMLRNHLDEKGIETRPFFHPIHTMPMYKREGENFSVAENLASRGINLPSYPGLKEQELEYIIASINDFFL